MAQDTLPNTLSLPPKRPANLEIFASSAANVGAQPAAPHVRTIK